MSTKMKAAQISKAGGDWELVEGSRSVVIRRQEDKQTPLPSTHEPRRDYAAGPERATLKQNKCA